jgi:hypothetical protein
VLECSLFLQFHGPLFTGRPGVHYRPAHPHPPVEVSPDVTLATLKAVKSTAIMVVPTFIEVRAPLLFRSR